MADGGEVDNVLVAVRIRPRIMSAVNISQTAERHLPTAAARVGDDTIRMTEAKPPGSQIGLPPASPTGGGSGATDVKTQNFTFDAVFDEDATQEDLYTETTLAAVDAALEGRNATIMTYGQTGSGKTFTVLGAVSQNPLDGDNVVVRDTGLFLRVLRDVLTYRRLRSGSCHVVVAISVIEIYLDNVRDLLGKDPTANLKVAINSDSVDMPDLTIESIEHLRDAVNCYKKATGRRVSRATDANDQSSRSHALFCIEIFQQERGDNNPLPLSVTELQAAKEKGKAKAAVGQPFSCGRAGFPPVRHSRIVLTDLAGSEKMKTANAKGEALEEMKKINGSLTCLGNVVHALYSGAKHIPYRDSKLTIILRASFAAPKAHVVLIANVAPTTLTFDETLSTLFFANKVKAMKANVGAGNSSQDAILENEYMQSAKLCEDLCADLRLAKELNDPFLIFPSGMHPVAGPNRILAVPKASRQSNVATMVAQLSQAVRRQREAQSQRESVSDKEMIDQLVVQKTSELVHRRKDYGAKITQATDDLAHAKQIAAEWAKEEVSAMTATTSSAQATEAALSKYKTQSSDLKQKVATEDAELDRMKAQIAKIEADFRATHAAEFARFDAEDAAFNLSEAFHEKRHALIDKRLRSRAVRLEYLETATTSERGVVEAFEAERDFHRVGIYEWLRPAVINIAANAVVMSIRNHFTAPRRAPSKMPPAAATANAPAAAPRVPKMLPSGQALGGAKTQHADPNATTTAATEEERSTSPRPRGPKVAPRAPVRPDGTPVAPAPPPPLEVAPFTVFDSESLVKDVINYIGGGVTLLKHGRSGRPHLRFVYAAATPPSNELALSDPMNVRIYYCEDKAMKGASGLLSVPVASIQAVTLGQSTPVFQRSKRRDDYYFSFSVHYLQNQEPRTLDLVASNEAEYEAWVIGICALAKVNPAYGEPKQEIDRLPPPDVLTDIEETLCKEWHIRPQLLVRIRAKLEELRRIRDAPNVRLTPGGMRVISDVDIFRANVLWRYFLSEGYISPTGRGILQYLEYDDATTANTNNTSAGNA